MLSKFWISIIKKTAVIASLLVILILVLRNCHIGPPDRSNVKVPDFKPVVQKKDKAGNAYTEVQGTLFTKDQMQHITDSMSKVLGKGKVTHVIETITVIDTVIQVKEHDIYLDTVTGSITAKDSTKNSYLAFAGNYKTKQATLTLRLTPDTATFVTTIKKHLFRPSEMNVNIYHTNDLFTPAQGKAYTATVPKTIGCIGPMVGIGINGKPFFGVGITLNVFGIKLKH
jgi:hypothetical protein